MRGKTFIVSYLVQCATSYIVQCTKSYLVLCNALDPYFYSRLLYSKEAVLFGSTIKGGLVISVSLFGIFNLLYSYTGHPQ